MRCFCFRSLATVTANTRTTVVVRVKANDITVLLFHAVRVVPLEYGVMANICFLPSFSAREIHRFTVGSVVAVAGTTSSILTIPNTVEILHAKVMFSSDGIIKTSLSATIIGDEFNIINTSTLVVPSI